MNRVVPYAVLFVAAVLLQAFLFDNLGLGMYVAPLVYIVFIMLLPMDCPQGGVLLLGLLLGVCVDFLSGTAGLSTIATLAAAFGRKWVLAAVAGRESAEDGGIPSVRTLGYKKYAVYASVMLLLQCGVYFSFEAAGFGYYYLTLARAVCSAAVGLPLVWLITGIFVTRVRRTAENG